MAEPIHKRDEIRVFHQNLLSQLGMGAENEEGPKQIVCHRAGDETRALEMEDRRESKDLKPACLLCRPTCFSVSIGWTVPRKSLLKMGDGIK